MAKSYGMKPNHGKMLRAPIMKLFFIWRLHGKPRHGYLLLQDVRDIAVQSCKPSTVYALLANMEKGGLIKSKFDKSGRHPRRLYQTTQKGWGLYLKVKKTRMKGLWREFVSSLLAK